AYARQTPHNRIDPLWRCGAEPAFGSRDRARCRLAVEKGFAALLKSRAVCGFRLQRRVDARLHAVDLSRAGTGLATNGRYRDHSRTQHDDVPNGHDLPSFISPGSIADNFVSDLFTGRRTGGHVLRRSVNARGQTWIDLLWGQAWLRLGRGERLRRPALSRNCRNTPGPRRRAVENIREARCDLCP